MPLKEGDQVQFKPQTMLWSNHRKAIGTVLRIFSLPGNGFRVDVRWDSDEPPAHGLPADLLSVIVTA